MSNVVRVSVDFGVSSGKGGTGGGVDVRDRSRYLSLSPPVLIRLTSFHHLPPATPSSSRSLCMPLLYPSLLGPARGGQSSPGFSRPLGHSLSCILRGLCELFLAVRFDRLGEWDDPWSSAEHGGLGDRGGFTSYERQVSSRERPRCSRSPFTISATLLKLPLIFRGSVRFDVFLNGSPPPATYVVVPSSPTKGLLAGT